MEIKSYICPNCGANTTNAQNCEYCGSLLVRFVERGIDLSHTNYTNNSGIFPGLIEELNRNLKLQEENPEVAVVTDLTKIVNTDDMSSISILSGLIWRDDTQSPEFAGSDKKQLCIVLNFDTYTDVSEPWVKEFNQRMDAELAKFRQLDSFPLFTPHSCAYVDENGFSRYAREYAINFGEDAEGAARLISEILIEVEGWSPTDTYDMFTNVGDDVERARKEWKEAHGFSNSTNDNSGYAGIIIAFIAFISTVIYYIYIFNKT